tara:strand:+ start:60 stop:185 length:126 start_codon:yes stop_codon:yes gene_type:complete
VYTGLSEVSPPGPSSPNILKLFYVRSELRVSIEEAAPKATG